MGSLFRLADALGLEHIYLSGSSPRPPQRGIRKTSRSTEKVLPYSFVEHPLERLMSLKQDGYTIIALEITCHSKAIDTLSLQGINRVCLILGSEKNGIQAELLAAADQAVHIPMRGQNSSMNVAMAAAIASYVLTRELLTETPAINGSHGT